VQGVNVIRRAATNVCYVLREDPELAEAIEPERRDRAVELCVAREVRIPVGTWEGLRPWHDQAEASTLPLTIDWVVLEPARVAVLDERFTRQLAHYPQLAGRLFARAVARSRHLVVNMAIVHQARVDVRLHMLFWHLAGRWGKVRTDGIVVPLRLTHTVLSDLVAARRPTVTSALSDLARRGDVHSVDEGWLLSGDPPGELQDVVASDGQGS
jgi:CRP/FNR family cyclic AMP-dependent transcriptional regulator